MTCFMFLFSSVFYKKITDMNICETQVCVGCRLEAAAASIGLRPKPCSSERQWGRRSTIIEPAAKPNQGGHCVKTTAYWLVCPEVNLWRNREKERKDAWGSDSSKHGCPVHGTHPQRLDPHQIYGKKIFNESLQELRMLSRVTINCQVTKIFINPGSQMSVL